MKKIFEWTLSLVLILPVFIACSDKNDEPDPPEIIVPPDDPNLITGTAGDLKWELKNGVLTISGTGAIPDYKDSYDGSSPWYREPVITSVIINDGVTRIGDYAFKVCSNLTSVTFAKTVKTIGEGAFDNCIKLSSITWPEGLTDIGKKAFYECALTSLTLPNSLQTMGELSFSRCGNLKTVIIPGSLKTIGERAFESCSEIESLTLSQGLTIIGDYAFQGAGALTGVVFPESLKEIGNSAFRGTGLTSITIPEGVTKIDMYAFYYTEDLVEINLPWEYPKPMRGDTWGLGYDYNSKGEKISVYVPYGSKYRYLWEVFHNIPLYNIIEVGDGYDKSYYVIDLGYDLYLPGKIHDPEGSLLIAKVSAEEFEQLCKPGADVTGTVFQNVYNLFDDDFDFIYKLLDTFSVSSSLGYTGIYGPVKNEVQGIGRPIYSDANWHGYGEKLTGIISTSSRGVVGNLFPHELCHAWSNYLFNTYDQNNEETGGHWGLTHMPSGGGHLGGFQYIRTVETNSGGIAGKTKYQTSVSENLNPDGSFRDPSFGGISTNGGWNRQYSDIELYSMGLKSAQELRDADFRIDIYTGISSSEDEVKDAYFYATGKTSYTIDDIIRIHGPRVPDVSSSPKTFRVLTILFTTDAEKDNRNLISSMAWVQGPPVNSFYDYNFRYVTHDLASVDFSGLRNSLKPQYKHLLEEK